MGGKKKQGQPVQKEVQVCKPSEKRFVNLLHVYTIYKQKFRRLTKEEFEVLLCHGCKGKRVAIELCKEFMKSKQISEDVNFEKNIGFLSVPRLMPLIALLAERAGYDMEPSLVRALDFSKTPSRFQDKFLHLLVYGFWFLGRVISDSLSVKDQINRGNMFNFSKGDMGFWWAGVRILDWNFYSNSIKKHEPCYSFVCKDPPKFRLYTNGAIINMHQHPLYFLSDQDWDNYIATVKNIRYSKFHDLPTENDYSETEFSEYEASCSFFSQDTSRSVVSSLSNTSIDTLASSIG